jgi:hypothetical protein
MRYQSLAVVLLAVLSLPLFISAQTEILSFTDRASFTAATDNLKTLDFEGIAANSGFVQFKNEGHFATAGIDFRPGGGARFGPGHLTVVGPWYQAGPIYETTSGAKVLWSPPNQPGNAYLDIFLPGGTTAVGTDFWAAQPYVSPVEVEVTTAEGKKTLTISTPNRPTAAFVGFVSESEIRSIRFTTAKGQTGLVVDNFSLGSADREAVKAAPVSEAPRRPTEESSKPEPGATKPATESQTTRPVAGATSSTAGKIAYVRGNTEIRVIDPDGTNDRQFWTHPDLTKDLGIHELDWRPDGKELAFSSSHASAMSQYHADIYAIGEDGSGLRKITNPPGASELARFKKGSVTLIVKNGQSGQSTSGSFVIYVAGADAPVQVGIPSGSVRTIVFKSVADFGSKPQPIVATFGDYRWIDSGVDVVAGRNVTETFEIGGEGAHRMGAYRPTWKADGSQLSYGAGPCIIHRTSAKPSAGENAYNPIFPGKTPMGSCVWDHGPTPETANKLVYSENSSTSDIDMITEGGAAPGTKITSFAELDYQLPYELQWIPDGSGFLYSTTNKWRDSGNIFRYDFATKKTTQITKLKSDFAKQFSISPDSTSIVFQRCKAHLDDNDCDIWISDMTGGGMKLLVKNGLRPAWGK